MKDYNFGNFIFELRSEKGLSQSEFGKMLGVTNKAVSKWENGTAKPNTSLFPKIGEILGVSVEELFAGKRIEKDSEACRLRLFLQDLKHKYAKLSSLFLALTIIFPLLIAEYTIASQIFFLTNDDLLALGAATLILGFIIAIVCSIVYTISFKNIPDPNEVNDTAHKFVSKGLTITLAVLIVEIILLPTILALIEIASPDMHIFKLLSLLHALFVILTFGILCYFLRLKKLLKVKISNNLVKASKPPLYIKLAIWAEIILLPLKINFDFLYKEFSFTKIIVSLLFWSLLILIIIYNFTNSRNKKK